MPYSEPPPDQMRTLAAPLILAGGFLLAVLAGFVNTSMLTVFSTPVSHMSGAVSTVAIDIGANHREHLPLVLKIIGGFFLGAVFSGMLIGSQTVEPGRRYGVALILEALLLLVSALLIRDNSLSGVYWAATACGLQNAMASSYYGLIVRTTHVTGIVTDLGAMIGSAIRHRTIKAVKLGFLLLILGGFFAGGYAGTLLHGLETFYAMLLAALFCALLGSWYAFWKHLRLPLR